MTTNLKKKLLKERGLQSVGYGKIVPIDEAATKFHKTWHMKYLEVKHHTPIDQLLYPGTIYAVAKRLGVDYSTVSKWRKIIKEAE